VFSSCAVVGQNPAASSCMTSDSTRRNYEALRGAVLEF